MFDVDSMELNTCTPWFRRFEQVLDLVAVNINGENSVLGLPHELLAEMGSYESTGSDHTDGEGKDRVSVEVGTSSGGGTRGHG